MPVGLYWENARSKRLKHKIERWNMYLFHDYLNQRKGAYQTSIQMWSHIAKGKD